MSINDRYNFIDEDSHCRCCCSKPHVPKKKPKEINVFEDAFLAPYKNVPIKVKKKKTKH